MPVVPTSQEVTSIDMLDDVKLQRARMAYRFGLITLIILALFWSGVTFWVENYRLLFVPFLAATIYIFSEMSRSFWGDKVAFTSLFYMSVIGVIIASFVNAPNDGIVRTTHIFFIVLAINPYISFYDRPLWVRFGLSLCCILMFVFFHVTDITFVDHNPVPAEQRQLVAYVMALFTSLCAAAAIYFVHSDLTLRDKAADQLRKALVHDQLELFYQPQVDAFGNIVGAEALLRWKHPTMGILTPDKFIPYAEKTGSIVEIGQWVVKQACKQLSAWSRVEALSELQLSVNISARELQEDIFVEYVKRAAEKHEIGAGKLILEITESTILSDKTVVIDKINQLKALGIGFSLDDMGTGYSSLSLIKDLPVSEIKIDRSFVWDISPETKSAPVTDAMITLGQSMDVKCVAEGIEIPEQWQYLIEKGCEYFQGYYFGKPMEVDTFNQFAHLKRLGDEPV